MYFVVQLSNARRLFSILFTARDSCLRGVKAIKVQMEGEVGGVAGPAAWLVRPFAA